MTTWFLDGFNVTGYLWINGEKGSRKTNLLILISQLSYLGFFISASGSFASLRDMADYGATTCCDDAENITDPRKTDPDKMALFLAGNRKGLTIPLKEQGPDKKWHTRFVNAYSARAFSAIRVPDSTLASRSIILPLLRTPDRAKANIDPMDNAEWTHDRDQMIDDLWAITLAHLAELPEWDKWVGKNSRLYGRNLQPWRAVFAVAKWLESFGAKGIYERMECLAEVYQEERSQLEATDFTRVVIQAVCQCASSAISAAHNSRSVILKVEEVRLEAMRIVEKDSLDFVPELMKSGRVGRILARLRFPEVPRPGGKGSRLRTVDLNDLAALADSYKVAIPPEIANRTTASLEASLSNGTNGTYGTIGTQPETPEFSINSAVFEGREQVCFGCNGTDFWKRDDGVLICSQCHPDLLIN
jgi:hypothetical protein